MKFAVCNEMFGDMPFGKMCQLVRSIGYSGLEIAPFTLMGSGYASCDIREVSSQRLLEFRKQITAAELEFVGLHWLLAKTDGFHLTTPEADVRRSTAEYLRALAECCATLGGSILVLGSPQQRNLLPGVSYAEGELYAAEILRDVMPACERLGVAVALEPLGPAEGNFMTTAAEAMQLARLVNSPCCRLHLDVKAMATEAAPIPDIIRENAESLVHFHANDPNLYGPGMGDVDFAPILNSLIDIHYDGWVSVEVFKYNPTPASVARISLSNLRKAMPTCMG